MGMMGLSRGISGGRSRLLSRNYEDTYFDSLKLISLSKFESCSKKIDARRHGKCPIIGSIQAQEVASEILEGRRSLQSFMISIWCKQAMDN